MDIRTLKEQIENKTVGDAPLIFVGKESFIPMQYIKEIGNIQKRPISFIEELSLSVSLFKNFDNSIRVFRTDEFSLSNERLFDEKSLYIVCSKISSDCKKLYSDIVVEVPTLEAWQVQDYATSMLPEISEKELKWLCDLCNNDINRVSREVDRIKVFSSIERQSVFNDCKQQHLYDDMSNQTVFDFTNAIMKRDKELVTSLYKQIGVVDIEPLGVVTILKRNFEDLIAVQMHSSPSPEICNMKPNKFWAVKHNCGIWTSRELLNNYQFLLTIDELVKSGEVGTDIELIDYVLCHIF